MISFRVCICGKLELRLYGITRNVLLNILWKESQPRMLNMEQLNLNKYETLRYDECFVEFLDLAKT